MKEFENKKNIIDLKSFFSDAKFLKQIDVILQEKKQIILLVSHN